MNKKRQALEYRQPTSHRRTNSGLTLLAVLLIFAPLFTLVSFREAGAIGPYTLMVSLSPDRTNAVELEGKTASGAIFVFTAPNTADITRVRFWLDNPSMSGKPRQSEGNAPYDFAGGTLTTANPFDTTTISDGSHTITAAFDLSGGTTEVAHASFTAVNSGSVLSFTPGSLSFAVSEAAADSETAALAVSDGNAAGCTVSDNAAWLTVAPETGTTPATLTVSVDSTGLAAGTYTATITASVAGLAPAILPVTLTVTTPYDQVHLAWTDDPSTTLTVVWRTWETTTPSNVQYRPQGAATWQTATGALRSSGTTGTLHEATIAGLTSSTSYEYRVQGDGNTWSAIFSTRTAPPLARPTSTRSMSPTRDSSDAPMALQQARGR